jgi:hypothetical protein
MKNSIFIEACKWGHAEIVQMMLDRGADVNACLPVQSHKPKHQAIRLQYAALMATQLFN